MSRYELSISMDYVSKWTYIEAVREIFQNALDEETVNPENKMFVDYNKETSVLRIGNKKGFLDKKTLLLGVSSKRDDTKTIGQHGEGYKIATVVLLREGFDVKIYNFKHKELWTAKKVKSRRYNTEIPVFDIEKYIFKSVPDNDLVFEITGITEEMFKAIVNSNLHLMKMYGVNIGEIKTCEKGAVLLDDKFKGHIYVNGLFVRVASFLTYGYDFAPELIQLDRDRDLIENFNLKWSIGHLLRNMDVEFVKSMIDTPDAEYLYSSVTWKSESLKKAVSNSVYDDYIEEFGKDTVPCTKTDDFNTVTKMGKKAVMISEQRYSAISHSEKFGVSVPTVPTLREQFESWYKDACEKYLPEDFIEENQDLINRVMSVL